MKSTIEEKVWFVWVWGVWILVFINIKKTHIFKCFVPVGSAEVDGVVKGGVRGGLGWGSAGSMPFTNANRLHNTFVKRRDVGKNKGRGKKGVGLSVGGDDQQV
jgi:hypothetical protein